MSASAARFLILLPAEGGEATLQTIQNAYGDSLLDVLKEVALHSREHRSAAVLEIALACPHLLDQTLSRRQQFDQTQRLVSLLYKLIVILATRHQINVEDQSGVDVRIILLAWDPDVGTNASSSIGPVVDINTLADCGRPWQHAFGVESEQGAELLKAFLAARQESRDAAEAVAQSRTTHATRCHDVAVGGTFDHMHIGHKLLLLMTLFATDDNDDASIAKTVTIGITGDELLKNKKHAEMLETWDERQRAVEDFCDSMLNFSQWPSKKRISRKDEPGPNGKSVELHYSDSLMVRCIEIQDPFGPTITEEKISTLVISGETRSGGIAVNDKRNEKGWQALHVLEVDVLDAQEDDVTKQGFGAKLSSTAIRQRLAAKQS